MARKPKIEIKKDKAGETRVTVKGGNGEKVAQTEGYKTPAGARKAAARLKKLIDGSEIDDKTAK